MNGSSGYGQGAGFGFGVASSTLFENKDVEVVPL